MNSQSHSRNISKKIAAFTLIFAMVVLVVPFGSFDTVNAASYITSSGSAKGSAYTSSPDLASKLDAVFAGDIGLCTSTTFKSSTNAKLGSSVMTGSKLYFIKNKTTGGITSGWQCFIYANAVYNTLFNEYVGHATSLSNSKVLISGGSNTASYNQFKNAGVKCGAYVRTTNKSSGAYNGSVGHSLIVLSYDANNITYLEGNADGKGLVRVTTRTWSDFNSNQLSGRSRYICHVVQPKDTYYNSLYSVSSGSKSTTTTTTKKTATTTATTSTSVDPSGCKVSYSRTLSYKSSVMSGNDVKYVQTCLKYLGYTVTINSKFDSTTLAAIKKFQSDASITVDGKCGPGTWSALEKAVAAKKKGSTSVTTAKTTTTTKATTTVKATTAAKTTTTAKKTTTTKTATTATVASANITLTAIAVKSNPTKTEYVVGDKLNTSGLKLTASYSDKSTKTVTSGFTCNVSTLSKAGTTKVTVTYGGKTATFNVTVREALKITAQPTNSSAKLGNTVTFTVKATGEGLKYQWQLSDDGKNWRNSSIKEATYRTAISKINNNRQVRCVITDKYGNKVTSGTATMKIK